MIVVVAVGVCEELGVDVARMVGMVGRMDVGYGNGVGGLGREKDEQAETAARIIRAAEMIFQGGRVKNNIYQR
jgi:hypothetical protein